MVSVMGSLLSHSLWRAVGVDPHHRHSHSDLMVNRDLTHASTSALSHAQEGSVCRHAEGNISHDPPGRRCDQTSCWRLNEEDGRKVNRGSDADTQDRRSRVHQFPVDAVAGVPDADGVWMVLDTPKSSQSSPLMSSSCTASWNARTCSVTFPLGGTLPSAPSPSETPPAAREWWDGCLPPPQAPLDQGHVAAQSSSSSLLDVCASTYQGLSSPGLSQVGRYPEVPHESCTADVAEEAARPDVDSLAVSRESGQELTSHSDVEELTCQVDHELTCAQLDQDKCSHVDQKINLPHITQNMTSDFDQKLSGLETTQVTCPDLSTSLRGRSVLGSREVATPGSSGSGSGGQRWRRQCVRRSRSEDSYTNLRRPCAASRSAYTMNSNAHTSTTDVRATDSLAPQDDRPLPPEPPPPVRDVDSCGATPAESSGLGMMEGGRLRDIVGYREDIRDFDIYKITPPVGEGQYPRLPALPAQSDSDTDEEANRYKGLRKRKRRKVERRDAGERKRYREEEEEEDVMMALEATTLLLPSAIELHQNFNTITVRPNRTVSQASSSSNMGEASTRPIPSAAATTASSVSRSEGEKREEVEDVASDDTMSDENEDDDEASTVVPEDFGDDTDSDIEVLIQSESWVDLSNQPGSPDRVTPLSFGNGEEYLRLLREAQRESNQSSARVSLASSRRDTPKESPHDSPKSPPNSPNTEMATDPEEAVLKGVYINYYNKEGDFIRVEKNTETDWIWDWSSRPDQTPPKEWRFSHPRKGVSRGASIRRVMVGNSSLFSRDVLYTLLITNVLSLLIGTGIGIWLSKRSGSEVVTTLSIN
ncbi:uncharacterized protein BNIP3 [Panulirus ornatus]|uniref:uncharacterized protein BNIP3 n=1 Tax=Panulirus ornatus TaxID=150431 RepID=UPI003A86CF83